MTNAQRLAEAEQAYHALMTGTQVRVFVDQDGTRVEYTATNKASLYSYIQTLRSMNAGGDAAPVFRPLGFTFPG